MKIARFVFPILFLLSVTACTIRDRATTPSAYPVMNTTPDVCQGGVPTAIQMPTFLVRIYPVGAVSKDEYEQSLTDPIFKGVQITVSAEGIDHSILDSKDVEYRLKKISERVSLFVDGALLPNDTSTLFDGLADAGPFYFSWPVKLNIGIHEAKLVFDTEREGSASYTWAFCIYP